MVLLYVSLAMAGATLHDARAIAVVALARGRKNAPTHTPSALALGTFHRPFAIAGFAGCHSRHLRFKLGSELNDLFATKGGHDVEEGLESLARLLDDFFVVEKDGDVLHLL